MPVSVPERSQLGPESLAHLLQGRHVGDPRMLPEVVAARAQRLLFLGLQQRVVLDLQVRRVRHAVPVRRRKHIVQVAPRHVVAVPVDERPRAGPVREVPHSRNRLCHRPYPLEYPHQRVLVQVGLWDVTQRRVQEPDEQVVGLELEVAVRVGPRPGARLLAPPLVEQHRALRQVVREHRPVALSQRAYGDGWEAGHVVGLRCEVCEDGVRLPAPGVLLAPPVELQRSQLHPHVERADGAGRDVPVDHRPLRAGRAEAELCGHLPRRAQGDQVAPMPHI